MRMLGTSWFVWMHPRSRTARLTRMHPAIPVIPTSTSHGGYTSLMRVLNGIMGSILMIPLAGMILLSPAAPVIRVVGISGRCRG